MTTALIVVCILFCIAVVLAITGHLGFGIVRDKGRRIHLRRHHEARGRQKPGW